MGRGGTNLLLSSGITCKVARNAAEAGVHGQPNLEEVVVLLNIGGRDAQVTLAFTLNHLPTPVKVIGTSRTGN